MEAIQRTFGTRQLLDDVFQDSLDFKCCLSLLLIARIVALILIYSDSASFESEFAYINWIDAHLKRCILKFS